MVYLSVCCGELCLQIRLSVCWLEVMFAIGFVCWVGGYVCYWVCLFVGLWTCHNIFFYISRDGVSVGLFHYRIKAIPWILNYKWADYWPLLSICFDVAFFCYVYYHGLFVSCLGWCGCWAFFFFCCFFLLLFCSICTELLCFGRGI